MNFDQYFARITADNSPDIIESTFDIFKYKQSPNKLNGVTVWGGNIGICWRICFNDYIVKECLCRSKIKDINLWRHSLVKLEVSYFPNPAKSIL